MSETVRYTIGAGVRCADGQCGSLKRVVIDPLARIVTHLVVDPGKGDDKLVPVSLLAPGTEDMVLHCGEREFEALESAEEERFLSGDDTFGYDARQTMVWPYFGPAVAIAGLSPSPLRLGAGTRTTTQERIPAGEVQIRRGEHVASQDGEAGRVHGLVIDDVDHTVTHVLLSEGHLWGKKTIAVPVADIDRTGTSIHVNYTKDELKGFPEIDLTPTTPA
ncbi:hypothetical protein [Streptomyces sp. NBC_01497]|uniref:hypothetical protein n=1 Tax=Streptomyces sp. NBC_01497 TaxID=2903885 RepID=UPI002E353021|nr:hypothetical protein [Streptomyces sp. NBC_01497]